MINIIKMLAPCVNICYNTNNKVEEKIFGEFLEWYNKTNKQIVTKI